MEGYKIFPYVLEKELRLLAPGGYHAAGPYSMEAYDWRGNYIYPRGECTLPSPFDDKAAETWGYVTFGSFRMDAESRDYLNDYISYCECRGVKVYVTTAYYLDEAVRSTDEEGFEQYDQCMREQIHAPLISRTKDHMFPRKFIYNAVRHANDAGMRYQTELLYRELRPYLKT